jgi:hypothetical protein
MLNSEPNSQNIPIRTQEGAAIKAAFERTKRSADFNLGYEAAGYGEKRSWCEAYGAECCAGWDAYWEEYGPRF